MFLKVKNVTCNISVIFYHHYRVSQGVRVSDLFLSAMPGIILFNQMSILIQISKVFSNDNIDRTNTKNNKGKMTPIYIC